jgi:hypothetical protein
MEVVQQQGPSYLPQPVDHLRGGRHQQPARLPAATARRSRRQQWRAVCVDGRHDVPSCITEGTLPSDGWENRSASLAGALRVMKQTSGESQKVELLSETAVHIYPKRGENHRRRRRRQQRLLDGHSRWKLASTRRPKRWSSGTGAIP